MQFSWPIMLAAIGGLVVVSVLVVWGVRLLARKDRDDEDASRLGVELAAVLAREPRLAGAAILPVATIPARAAAQRGAHGPRALGERARRRARNREPRGTAAAPRHARRRSS